MLTALATRTVSGKTPPLAFRITLWILAIAFLAAAVAGAVLWWRLRKQSQELPGGQQRAGRASQAGCLMIAAVPSLLLGIFLLDWAVQVS